MAESINQRINAAKMSAQSEREMRALMASVLADLTALAAQVNQVIDDVETTATEVTLNTQA